MPESEAAMTTLEQAARSGGLMRRLVLRELARLGKGRLRLLLPEGGLLNLGDPAETRPGALIKVTDEHAFRRIVLSADIGLTEGYIEGEWESPDLAAVIGFFLENIEDTPNVSGSSRKALALGVLRLADRIGHILRPNTRTTARRNIAEHYDLSNDFFRLFLDPSMMYSSARWNGHAGTLEEAQREKNEALCRHLRLGPADHLIEIGTGWGGFALHAASTRGCRITSLTISPAQRDLAVERIRAAGLSDRIEVRLEDFRDHRGSYDKCVSIEMMEALGHRYLPAFCESVGRLLKPRGLAAFQYITCPDARYEQFRKGVDFIQKHIFPGSLLLSVNRVNSLMTEKGGFQLHALDDFGPDYARTLDAWARAFEANLAAVRSLGFDERFIRKWRLYLRYCEAAFAHRNIGVVQALYTRPNNPALDPA
jgi:cyclopropane-fatty-acyl-phospholipid synthase